MSCKRLRRLMVPALVALCIAPAASAELQVRVDARPRSKPIEAHVRATDDGSPIARLVAKDFLVTVDGVPVEQFDLTLPPRQDPTQKISLVIIATRPLPAPSPVANVDCLRGPDQATGTGRFRRGCTAGTSQYFHGAKTMAKF